MSAPSPVCTTFLEEGQPITGPFRRMGTRRPLNRNSAFSSSHDVAEGVIAVNGDDAGGSRQGSASNPADQANGGVPLPGECLVKPGISWKGFQSPGGMHRSRVSCGVMVIIGRETRQSRITKRIRVVSAMSHLLTGGIRLRVEYGPSHGCNVPEPMSCIELLGGEAMVNLHEAATRCP